MTGWRTLALVVGVSAAGAAGTLAVGAATGMGSGDLAHLLSLLVPAAAATVIAALASRPLLARASLRQRFVAPALIAVMVALANLAVLTMQMFVSDHDATLVTALLLYSIGSGVGVALTLARSSSVAVERLVETAEALGGGDLEARAGDLGAGSELEMLARTLDDMARRLQAARTRELALEGTRRDLITAVSHDLRTPLASLRAMVEAIDEGVVDDAPSVRRYVGEMRSSVLQLSGMVDDLFELAQLDAGAIEVETRHARLDEVVHSAVAAVEPAAQRKRLVLVADLEGVEDVACSPRLTRVLQNLLGNAVRHTPADGTVRIAARRSEGGLELAVEDTGEGMTPEDLARVFDPFFRADPSRSGGGAGLGLSLAKRIVETLGGRISAESTPAAGSRFAVLLPIS
ncbi:MAG TPA: HAMP domain-containing sensor histidine kinase [Actinomycetota bacterium]|jgi:signal transduction histidine kinase|nr:HAMP domain-containing sensor histidine kinase [Actinomycetota bacterium]